MDRFKKYLLENKSRLDFEEPGELVWIGIEKRISKSKQKTIIVQLLKWTVAASILVLAGIGFYSVIKAGKKDIGTSFAKNIIIPVSVERIKIESTTLNNEVPKKKIRPTKPGILIAKPKKKPAPNGDLIEQSLSSFVAALEYQKTIISSTPVFGVSQDYFRDFISMYRNLENDEQRIRKQIKSSGVNGEVLDEMIRILKRRVDILILLKTEMDKVNEMNKGQVAEKTYINII